MLVNSLGGPETRAAYKTALAAALAPNKDKLSNESQRRLGQNPLRILDSKDPRDQELVATCPSLTEFLSAEDRAHFEELQKQLRALGTPFTIEPRLVRGLDYYTRTLFEIKGATAKLGAGDTLVGGGRYDGMVAELGGPNVPAIGFAAGLERLLIASEAPAEARVVDVMVAPIGEAAVREALVLSRELRRAGISTEADMRGGSLKSQLRRANGLGARIAIIVGEAELASGLYEVKDLAAHAQAKIARADLVTDVAARLGGPK